MLNLKIKIKIISTLIAKFGYIFVWMIANSTTSQIWKRKKKRKKRKLLIKVGLVE